MNGLKQTLGKQDSKKGKKVNLTTTNTKNKKSQWNDLNSVIQCKSPNKYSVQSQLDTIVTSIIQNSFKNNSIISLDKVVKEILQKCKQSDKYQSVFIQNRGLNKTIEDEELKKLEQIKLLVGEILNKKQKSSENNEAVSKFYDQLTNVIKKKHKITKRQKLQEYDKLIRMLSPKVFGRMQKQKKSHLPPSLSSNNLNIKVTKQEYQIKRESSHDSSIRVGSEGKRVKTSGSNYSAFKSQNGHQKFKKFLSKQPSLKIIKTTVQYDYSAIFEASRAKIQPRSKNITTQQNSNKNNDITTKLNKAKKNEAFVFYRPPTGHK